MGGGGGLHDLSSIPFPCYAFISSFSLFLVDVIPSHTSFWSENGHLQLEIIPSPCILTLCWTCLLPPRRPLRHRFPHCTFLTKCSCNTSSSSYSSIKRMKCIFGPISPIMCTSLLIGCLVNKHVALLCCNCNWKYLVDIAHTIFYSCYKIHSMLLILSKAIYNVSLHK